MGITGSLNRRHILKGLGFSAAALAFARPAFAAEPMRIGALNPITGSAAAFGTGIQKTIVETCNRINALGGAAGRPFEVFAEDTETLPEPALLAARKLIGVNNVQALLGVCTSPEALAVMPVSNAADVLLMHTGSAYKLTTENVKGLGFQFYPNNTSVGSMVFKVVEREGFQTPLALTLTNDATLGNTNAFLAKWKEKTGKAPENIQYQPGQPNYRSELQQALSLNPDVIFISGYEPDATIIVKQLYELGNTAQILAPDYAATPRLIAAVGNDIAEGMFVFRFVASTGSPAFAEFEEIHKAATGTSSAGNPYAAVAFDQVNLIALALEAAPTATTGSALVKSIYDVCGPDGEEVNSFAEGRELLKKGSKKLNYRGASGPCDFDKVGQTPANFGLNVVRNGKYEFNYDVEFQR